MEIWKSVKNYENLYEVSNIGRVRSLDKLISNQYDINTKRYVTRLSKEKILKPKRTNNGYYSLRLYKNQKHSDVFVHRLVAEAFIPNPDNLPQVNHKNGRKLDNRANNLEWCTPKENIKHAQQHKLFTPEIYNAKPILDITTNTVYKSAMDAAKEIHKEVPTSKVESIMKNIKRCCYGKRPTAYKHKWKSL